MGLITQLPNVTSATVFNEDVINDRYDPIVEEFNGNITNTNINSAAAISASKIADSAAVLGNTVAPGEQTFLRSTKLSGGTGIQYKEADLNGWSFDEDDTQAININGVTTFALTVGKGMYLVSITGAETLTTITGGAEGMVIYLLWQATDNSLTVTHTAAQTADTLSLRGRANETWTTAGGMFITRFRFSAVGGTGKWYEC